MSRKLLKASAVVSFMTLISRVLGLARDVVIANLLGAGNAADVYFFAQKIPNFLRRLFAEGAFSQAFVPVLADVQQNQGEDAMRALVARVAGTLGAIITGVTVLGIVGSPVLAMLFGTGWFVAWVHGEPDGAKFELAALMLKITFPYLWFISLTALAGAVLNTLGRFAVAAFTPVFLNVAIIACAIWLAPHLAQPEIGLAWGVFLGGVIQMLFQVPFMYKAGFLVRPRWAWHDEGVARIRKLMIPALFGVSVSQINLLLDTFIASWLVGGSISWLYYSDRLLEFPLGLFGIAIATVILPSLSRRHAGKEADAFAHTMDWGVRMILLLGLPAAAGMIVLAAPLLMVLFLHGAFDTHAALGASHALWAYGTGLVAFMMIKVLAPGFYATQDTKTPVRIGIIAMVSNMVLNIALASLLGEKLGYIGLAAATSMSAFLNAGLLGAGLWRRHIYRPGRLTWLTLGRILLATGAMVAVLSWFNPGLDAWQQAHTAKRALWLVGLIGSGALTYGATLLIVGFRPRHLKAGSQS
ncbi:murein biosynthesis integral membrane protein MurJ [Gallaecimonas kandeliae]|uniref:murein biosynthesis integral membrane protein MurJ n=1 Tax=Gallaecimonas kandeliae TaxID=3029055 RepID=UPI002647C287|nr:murein biosynthesis integral membrane protein MurJ [Gallaecimonas kandeliae]WKE64965.1 murein biosynthesis integral membrane protein MurJ [Gallaecimonas kandeliae]